MDGEDSVPNFRRNLLVFCSLVLTGWLLGVPVSAIVQKIVGVDFEPIAAWRLATVQTLAFLYFAHRYYTSPLGRHVFRDFQSEYVGDRNSRSYSLVFETLKDIHEEQVTWPKFLVKSKFQVIDEVNALRAGLALIPLDSERFSVEFGSPDGKEGDWTSFNARIRVWSSHQRFGNPDSVTSDIKIPFLVSLKIRAQSFGAVFAMSGFLTEQIIPLFLTAGTFLLLVFRWVVCLTGYVPVEACVVA
jgi:hypothetical protein